MVCCNLAVKKSHCIQSFRRRRRVFIVVVVCLFIFVKCFYFTVKHEDEEKIKEKIINSLCDLAFDFSCFLFMFVFSGSHLKMSVHVFVHIPPPHLN